ncbi:hypothetical protein RH858_13525 [Halalkaliarchaeum sp. AArc-GB]|uniref:DUF7473 family protein n=1 Tax=Halalkaliarchaeum sp. AArc-GB TaxID=3074078 RepID=UPI00285F3DC0|nr:hypothetical protein [Halalkaliarchaeum sp. AArc-GB]MDR5674151.1 hypothetical protein [Halalkaliarchaeum sp. AArc-GB]
MVPLGYVVQTGVSPLAVAGTFGLLAAFLSLTAFLAARNVLGDVSVIKALGVGPFPAAVAVVSGALDLPSLPAIAVALLLDGAAIHYLYGESASVSAYITLIHVVVTILLGTVLFGLLILLGTFPG